MNATLPSPSVSIAPQAGKSTADRPGDAGETRIIVIDADRRLIRASEAGRRVLDKEEGLRLTLERVRGAGQIDDARLDRALGMAARGELIEQVLPIGPKGAGLSLSIVALRGAGRDLEIMLLVRDAREDRRRALARAAAFFGFTGAETRLVTALYEGCSVPDAADRLGVAPTTARSHLQSVFAKTGVRRQGDLLTLLSNPGPALAFA